MCGEIEQYLQNLEEKKYDPRIIFTLPNHRSSIKVKDKKASRSLYNSTIIICLSII